MKRKIKEFRILNTYRVEISLPFLISSWVLVGPGLEFPDIEKTGMENLFVSGGAPTR